MAGSLHEAWRDAVRTWQTGDSILSPHSSELSAATTGRSVNWVAEGFKQADSIPNVLSNAYVGFMKAAGLPTRALGGEVAPARREHAAVDAHHLRLPPPLAGRFEHKNEAAETDFLPLLRQRAADEAAFSRTRLLPDGFQGNAEGEPHQPSHASTGRKEMLQTPAVYYCPSTVTTLEGGRFLEEL